MYNPLDNPDYVGPTARLAALQESLEYMTLSLDLFSPNNPYGITMRQILLTIIEQANAAIEEETEILRNHDTGKSDDLEILAAYSSICDEYWDRADSDPLMRSTLLSRLAGEVDGVNNSIYLLGGTLYAHL